MANPFTDPRDGKTYSTTKIGNQIWMAENLNFNCPGSKCYGKIYGRLYTWSDANNACPPGWHLPDWKEWITLFDFIDKRSSYAQKWSKSGKYGNYYRYWHQNRRYGGYAGYDMKASSGWNNKPNGSNGNGSDLYSFSALPGGFCENGIFGRLGEWGCWWTAFKSGNARLYISHRYPGVYTSKFNTSNLYSVRCVKDLGGI